MTECRIRNFLLEAPYLTSYHCLFVLVGWHFCDITICYDEKTFSDVTLQYGHKIKSKLLLISIS